MRADIGRRKRRDAVDRLEPRLPPRRHRHLNDPGLDAVHSPPRGRRPPKRHGRGTARQDGAPQCRIPSSFGTDDGVYALPGGLEHPLLQKSPSLMQRDTPAPLSWAALTAFRCLVARSYQSYNIETSYNSIKLWQPFGAPSPAGHRHTLPM